jgi:hypothetical protein
MLAFAGRQIVLLQNMLADVLQSVRSRPNLMALLSQEELEEIEELAKHDCMSLFLSFSLCSFFSS